MPEAKDYVPRDFLVQNKSNKKVFYVLQTSPEAKIDVFTEIR